MNIVLVSASSRPDSQSARICEHINQNYFHGKTSIVDVGCDELPVWNGSGFGDERVKSMREKLRAADGFVFVVPEWHGMAPAAIKNVFLWCGTREFGHKPALLVAVSSGNGGAFVINEMRTSGYKNSRLLYLPEHLILRDVEQLFKGDLEGESTEGAAGDEVVDSAPYIERRLAYALNLLTTYTASLMPVRKSLMLGLSDFPNGMS